MTTTQLIAALQSMPPDAEVLHLWDGEARTHISHVWLARGGYVVTAGDRQPCYSETSRPPHAPSEAEDPFWQTPI